jgi:condensin complex subunit 3
MKVTAIHTFADVAITHPSLLAPPPRDTNVTEDGTIAPPAVNPLVKNFTKVFLKGFSSDNPSINIAACTAASKLLLHGILPPTSILPILRAFTLAYFNPESSSNPALRQSLSYFLPVFCHSKLKNAALMAQIVVPVIKQLLIMREDSAEVEEEEMVGWPVICNHLAEWTDGRKVVGATEMSLEGKMVEVKGAGEAHLLLASEVLERALTSTCNKDERKPLLSLLGKLHISTSEPAKDISDQVEVEQLRTLHALITEAIENKLGADATSRNMLIKLETGLTKRLGEVELVTQVQDGEGETEAGAEDAEVSTTDVGIAPAPEPEPETDAASDAGTEANTEVEVESEPEEASTPRPQPTRISRQSKPPSSDIEMGEDSEDDTMLAHMQAEGTRMPLDYEDSMDVDMDDEEASTMTVERKANEKTEQDIMDELLSSELE